MKDGSTSRPERCESRGIDIMITVSEKPYAKGRVGGKEI
jgi:hypothetical protein